MQQGSRGQPKDFSYPNVEPQPQCSAAIDYNATKCSIESDPPGPNHTQSYQIYKNASSRSYTESYTLPSFSPSTSKSPSLSAAPFHLPKDQDHQLCSEDLIIVVSLRFLGLTCVPVLPIPFVPSPAASLSLPLPPFAAVALLREFFPSLVAESMSL
jgi:hypothetical protein